MVLPIKKPFTSDRACVAATYYLHINRGTSSNLPDL